MRRIVLLGALVALAAGLAVGSTTAGTSRRHWTITDLGTLGGGYQNCTAAAINDSAQVAGGCGDARGRQHAFLWQRGKMTDLGTLGGHDSGASLIDGRGQIAGTSLTARPARLHAFLWQNGKMTDLGTLGGRTSRPRALNDRGQVVGESERADGTVHAYLWQAGKMTDLGTLGGSESDAAAINARGWIVGRSEERRVGKECTE